MFAEFAGDSETFELTEEEILLLNQANSSLGSSLSIELKNSCKIEKEVHVEENQHDEKKGGNDFVDHRLSDYLSDSLYKLSQSDDISPLVQQQEAAFRSLHEAKEKLRAFNDKSEKKLKSGQGKLLQKQITELQDIMKKTSNITQRISALEERIRAALSHKQYVRSSLEENKVLRERI